MKHFSHSSQQVGLQNKKKAKITVFMMRNSFQDILKIGAQRDVHFRCRHGVRDPEDDRLLKAHEHKLAAQQEHICLLPGHAPPRSTLLLVLPHVPVPQVHTKSNVLKAHYYCIELQSLRYLHLKGQCVHELPPFNMPWPQRHWFPDILLQTQSPISRLLGQIRNPGIVRRKEEKHLILHQWLILPLASWGSLAPSLLPWL